MLILFKLIRLVSRLFRTLVIQKAGENQMQTGTLIGFLIINFRIANGRFLQRIFLANFGLETEHGRDLTLYKKKKVQLELRKKRRKRQTKRKKKEKQITYC